jgi:predicted phage terminase large subunit-like protein
MLAFRESAKSTITSLIYILWCICYKKKNFIILCSDSHTQAQLHLANVIYELQNNEMIIKHFGKLKGDFEKWTESNFVTTNGVRVMARGTGSKIRGVRHLQYRPDLFIGDDLENNELVKTLEQRDKTQKWLETEVLPAVDQEQGQLIVIGNMLHYDSLMARLRKKDNWQKIEVPIIQNGKPAWEARHTLTDIELIKHNIGSLGFAQEYMLEPILETDQIVRKSWIRYYTTIDYRFISEVVISLDPAISQKEKADYSAFTVWAKHKDGNFYLIDFVNERLSFDQQVQTICDLYKAYNEYEPMVLIEDVAYQKALIQHLSRKYSLPVKAVKPVGDKRSRLMEVSTYFENGLVYFKQTQEDVIAQIVSFGVAKNDDLVDSTIYAIKHLANLNKVRGFVKTNLRL